VQEVQAHPQNFLFVENLGKITENLEKILENLGTDALTPLFHWCDQ